MEPTIQLTPAPEEASGPVMTGKREVEAMDDAEQDSVLDHQSDSAEFGDATSGSGASPLPPRKRAKTDDEKEQRRLERIMRNRQAAHASREKKRKHLETLESRCQELTAMNKELEDSLRTVQRSQAQTLEQHSAMQARLEQLEAAVRLAKSSGDLGALDAPQPIHHSSLAMRSEPYFGGEIPGKSMDNSNGEYVRQNSHHSASPVPSLVDDCASPDALFIQPSYSDSTASSPLPVDEPEDADYMSTLSQLADPCAAGNVPLDSFSKAHHPAAMMSV